MSGDPPCDIKRFALSHLTGTPALPPTDPTYGPGTNEDGKMAWVEFVETTYHWIVRQGWTDPAQRWGPITRNLSAKCTAQGGANGANACYYYLDQSIQLQLKRIASNKYGRAIYTAKTLYWRAHNDPAQHALLEQQLAAIMVARGGLPLAQANVSVFERLFKPETAS